MRDEYGRHCRRIWKNGVTVSKTAVKPIQEINQILRAEGKRRNLEEKGYKFWVHEEA